MVKDRFAQRLWISFGIIAFSIVIAAFALNFFAGDVAAQANTIVSDRAEIQQQTASVANLASLEQEAPQAARYESAIDQVIPDQYGLVNFSQWFTQEGKQYDVTANASLQGDIISSQAGTPGSSAFSFDVEGPLDSITSFLAAVSSQSSGFLLSFGSFDLTNDGTNDKIVGQGKLLIR